MNLKPALSAITALWLIVAGAAVLAEPPPRVYPPGTLDMEFMEQQRERIDALARINLGRQLHGTLDNDLGILQDLLDRQLVKAEQTLELQAMGVVLGELLAQELSMHWVIYEDRHGRSRALQLEDSENFLFPITMISRRIEADARVDVRAVYDKATALIAPYRKPLPFQ
jgi:hypothetical protein